MEPVIVILYINKTVWGFEEVEKSKAIPITGDTGLHIWDLLSCPSHMEAFTRRKTSYILDLKLNLVTLSLSLESQQQMFPGTRKILQITRSSIWEWNRSSVPSVACGFSDRGNFYGTRLLTLDKRSKAYGVMILTIHICSALFFLEGKSRLMRSSYCPPPTSIIRPLDQFSLLYHWRPPQSIRSTLVCNICRLTKW
jgi:hypothetical protein